MKGVIAVRENQMVPVGLNSFYIKFSYCQYGVFKGRVTSPIMQLSADFTSLSRLVVLVEQWLDTPVEDLARKPEIPEDVDYVIEVVFRQAYDWQGKLISLRDEQEATFRSVLELLIQMEMIFS